MRSKFVGFVVVFMCFVLVGVGCSSGESANTEPEAGDKAVPLLGGETSRGSGLVDVESLPRPPLAGMYAHHSELLFLLEGFSGVVSIEPPCVYLVFDSDPSRELLGGELERLAISLPYPQVRFDEKTHTLWNGDVPISHGDRVLTGGGRGSYMIGGKEPHELYLFWDACPAHGTIIVPGLESVPLYCMQDFSDRFLVDRERMEKRQQEVCVEDTRPWNQRDWLEQQGIGVGVEPPVEGRGFGEPPEVVDLVSPAFLDMHAYHPDMELEVAKLVGVLSVELAGYNDYERLCAYLYPTVASDSHEVLWGDSWRHTGPDGEPLAINLELPYPQVWFDEANWSLWNGGIGPMATGVRVIVDPLTPPNFSDKGNGDYKQPHETILSSHCSKKAHATVTVLDIQPVEHYCANNPSARHRSQCEHAMNPTTQTQNQLTPPEGQRHR
ncbi:MAG: hypothetical protein OXE93_02430 [bacterium]|nr:hypothetical protein [bacterium]